MYIRFVLLTIMLAGTFFLPATPEAFAATTTSLAEFAGCSGTDCSACNVVSMANGLIKWLIGFLFVLFALIIAYAGFGLVTSGGNGHALDEAKARFSNAVIGIIIVLSAWLVVDTIMRGLVGRPGNMGQIVTGGEASGWLFWSQVQCYAQNSPTAQEYNPELFEPSIETYDTNGAVDLSTLPGYSGGRADFPVIAQSAGTITYANNVRLRAYSIDTTKAPYAYPNCGVTPPQFFKISESGNARIAKNFTVCELTNCGTSQRAGEYAYLDPRAVAAMDKVADAMGGSIRINSGYRSPSYNGGLDGSASCSQHMAGKAFDIAASGGYSTAQIEQICKQFGAGWTKQYATFTHCDWR